MPPTVSKKAMTESPSVRFLAVMVLSAAVSASEKQSTMARDSDKNESLDFFMCNTSQMFACYVWLTAAV